MTEKVRFKGHRPAICSWCGAKPGHNHLNRYTVHVIAPKGFRSGEEPDFVCAATPEQAAKKWAREFNNFVQPGCLSRGQVLVVEVCSLAVPGVPVMLRVTAQMSVRYLAAPAGDAVDP